MTRGKKTLITYVVLLFLVLGSIHIVGELYDSVDRSIRNAYAVWWVSSMVIEYMKTHYDLWPRDWDDLREPYETATRRSGRPWTFEELRERVDVDWSADPSRLARAEFRYPDPPFRAVYLKDGSKIHWQGAEPNELIWNYLRMRKH